MTKSVAIDETLLKEAQQLGHHKNGKEAVIAALKEYIQRNKQMAVIELFGQIEYQEDYNYKTYRL
ncbi:MAG TPA: type II toxin-antitoxin system VapB family antitoxin [Agitococcus sp.]|nr:type II toxin-antitoxin system VapB family antitoxin [Agitococcus sp.]HNH43337.1 type II toxin-antitoxin system VapB family antitoxin [Agitococcus sp.]HNP01461.1 type II toxin-antitoxin system VapB family antitoxin [Agitococcus sp.]